MPREESGRHHLPSRLDEISIDDNSPEPRPLPKKPDAGVTINFPTKAIIAIATALLSGGTLYGGHLLGSQKGDAAVAELHAMDVRVKAIEEREQAKAVAQAAHDARLDQQLDGIQKTVDHMSDGIDKINERLDRRGR